METIKFYWYYNNRINFLKLKIIVLMPPQQIIAQSTKQKRPLINVCKTKQ